MAACLPGACIRNASLYVPMGARPGGRRQSGYLMIGLCIHTILVGGWQVGSRLAGWQQVDRLAGWH